MKTIETRLLLGLITTVLLAFILGGFFKINAEANTEYFSTATDVAETTYRKELKAVLAKAGAANAGITLTKRCVDGHRYDYLVEVNLPKYIELNREREIELKEALNEAVLEVDDSTVTFSFS